MLTIENIWNLFLFSYLTVKMGKFKIPVLPTQKSLKKEAQEGPWSAGSMLGRPAPPLAAQKAPLPKAQPMLVPRRPPEVTTETQRGPLLGGLERVPV